MVKLKLSLPRHHAGRRAEHYKTISGGAMPSIPGRICCGVAFTTVLGHACFAQTVNQPEEAGILQEVVVTSQRRVENLQDVPIAATALDADALETKAVVQLADL